MVHLGGRLQHGHERALRVSHELVLRGGQHGLVVRMEPWVRLWIAELRLGMRNHAHRRLGGHRVSPDVPSARAIGILWLRRSLKGGGTGAVFLGGRNG